jgi:hypothetical protein
MGTTRTKPRFRVGDWVSFTYGATPVVAQVIEDRGLLGYQQRRLYGLRMDLDNLDEIEPTTIEMREEDLEPAAAPPGRGLPDKGAVIRYLREGGLKAVLRPPFPKGSNPPRAWLALDAKGHVTHRFTPARPGIGGATVPIYALQRGKIPPDRQEEVIAFLASFGLNRAEAEDVLRTAGVVA